MAKAMGKPHSDHVCDSTSDTMADCDLHDEQRSQQRPWPSPTKKKQTSQPSQPEATQVISGIEEDTIPQSQDQELSTTELHQVGILHKYGDIHSERGKKTCKFGFT